MNCRPWDQLGPCWPESNDTKRGQGGRPSAPNSRLTHLSPKFGHYLNAPKLTQAPKNMKFAINDNGPRDSSYGLWQPPVTVWQVFPSSQGNPFASVMEPAL
ncbi:hypothetical protein O181_092386 [Austropuccinia psidii MF-1]|uniref:Uncharacterized protein n=1 Tax=Austropuccinia psidii MF-1 TaxID=1389203 RepID=A0A9Q3IZ85_9BASI|nr:hypothetical protein [Austropuccinia psidii MF-1]